MTQTQTSPAIVLQSVAKHFRKKRVLDSISLQVEAGQIFALLGRNGEGKTTTIRMLLGLLRPSGGKITLLGLDPLRDPLEVRRRVGYLAENQAMYGWMTIAQIINFIAPFYPTWDHTLAQRYLKQFDLSATVRIKHLSKGQSVRLGLLLALAHRPKLVILDDPALGLDPIMRKQFNRDLVSELQGEGQTVFYSSHLVYEVEAVADTVAILDHGRIIKHSPTEALRDDVKRIILPSDIKPPWNGSCRLLDLQRSGKEAAFTVENAASAVSALRASGSPHRVVDLNLDEIFEAYVIGQTEDGDGKNTQPSIPEQASL